MNKCVKILLLTISVFFCFVLFVFPQTEQYKFEHITTEQGLSHNMTNCIIQDSKGFIWIGTNRGLDRYDGNNFKTYTSNQDSTSLTGVVIKEIFEDHDGNIWVGTRWSGLSRYNRALDNFRRFQSDPNDSVSLSHNNVNSICQDKDGIIWIGTYGGGLNKFNPGPETFSVYKQFPDHADHFADRIYDIHEDNEGIFWVAAEAGLFTFDHKKETFSSFDFDLDIPPLHQVFQCIYQDNNTILWFGSYHGLIRYNNATKETIHYSTEDIYSPMECIAESNIKGRKSLWVGTMNGLYRLDLESEKITRIFQKTQDPHSLSGNYVKDLCPDNTGNLWIATYNSGLNKLNLQKNPFQQYFLGTGPDEVQFPAHTFFMDNKGNLWVGARAGGLFKFDKGMNAVAHYEPGFFVPFRSDSIVTSYVSCLFEDSKDILWVSFSQLGLTIFDSINGSFIPVYGIPQKDNTTPIQIQDIIEDKNGRLWIGDLTKGLFYKEKDDDIYDPLRKVNHELLSKAQIRDLFVDSEGDIWVGTFKNGLFCLTPENRNSMSFIHYPNRESDTNGYYGTYINSFCEDPQGNLWITTSYGLNKFDPVNNKFIVYKQHKALFGDQIMKIFSDKRGYLWFNHYKYQLVRFNPSDSIQNPIKAFSTQDGLPFGDLSYRGLYQANDGRMFIGGARGTNNGFFSFNPDSVQENKQIPVLAVTDFKVKNEIFHLDSNITEIKNITLKHNENFFSFEFAALDYTNPEKNQYAYRLEGLENDWIYADNRRFANYTGIPPGDYIFRVKGSNNDGYWNEAGTSIAITIQPPPWKTWWAYSLYFIILLGIIYAWRSYDLKRQWLKQQLKLEHVEAEKLKELDSMKSRFFANISHEFRTPLTLILGPLHSLLSHSTSEKSKQDLNMMQRNALRLKVLIDQLLNLSKIESGKMKLKANEENIVALVNGYVQSFESLAKQKNIDLIFRSDEENIPLYVDKDKIEKILYNLLSNAFKFTGEGGEIEVAVRSQQSAVGNSQSTTHRKTTSSFRLPASDVAGQWVGIKVSDTGRGIPPDKLAHVFDRFYQADDSYTKDLEGTGIGLALARELVKIHHGNIIVESEEEKGSTFFVFLPCGKDHLKPDEIIEKSNAAAKSDKYSEPIPDIEFLENNIKPEDHQSHLKFERKDDKPYLLIVDDNTDLRIYMRGYLDELYYISEARDGEEGFNKAVENIPDLIISDVMMPKMDGYELCEKLKTDERSCHIPIILLTARASFESKIEGMETGADDFITKPFDPLELQTRVKNLIKQRQVLRRVFGSELKKGKLSLPGNISLSGMSGLDQRFIQKTWDVAEQHFSDPEFNVESFSREMAISRVHLHRKLKALTDLTASEFLRTYRLNKAAKKLANKEASVSEIAYDVGFSTVQYFSKCFFDQFGMSPTIYLEKHS